jgi:hypothetical protein
MSIEIPLSLPLDDDGFLRRECPECLREFKWHHGPIEGAPDNMPTAEEYYCPYCGQLAGLDQWWTQAQLEYVRETAAAEAMPKLIDQIRTSLRSSSGSGFRVEVETSSENPVPPAPLVEGELDMIMVASPCHTYEPVKILGDWDSPVHCLVCGSPYVLPGSVASP